MVGNWDRQRHIDPDHAYLDVVGEIACGFTVARKDAGTVAVLVVVDELHCLLFGLGAYDAQNRAKYFFLVNTHVLRNIVE